MNSRMVMIGAAIVLGVGGMACLFMPQEIIGLYYPASEGMGALAVQLLGAAYLSFAALDWVSRRSLLGGIYGRPVVGTNYTHFVIGSLLLLRAAIGQPHSLALWLTFAGYAALAVAFAAIFYGAPPKKDAATSP